MRKVIDICDVCGKEFHGVCDNGYPTSKLIHLDIRTSRNYSEHVRGTKAELCPECLFVIEQRFSNLLEPPTETELGEIPQPSAEPVPEVPANPVPEAPKPVAPARRAKEKAKPDEPAVDELEAQNTVQGLEKAEQERTAAYLSEITAIREHFKGAGFLRLSEFLMKLRDELKIKQVTLTKIIGCRECEISTCKSAGYPYPYLKQSIKSLLGVDIYSLEEWQAAQEQAGEAAK
ncbi:MAG: hypothetical protein HP002_09535 [Lentisphaeria bacterium]|nr:hypothetical protein [Lentisphaeria bacterium]